MELARVFLLSALFLVGFMLWNAWENEHPSKVVTNTAQSSVPSTVSSTSSQSSVPAAAPSTEVVPAHRTINIHTDVLNVAIDTQGGNIIQANLLGYPQKLHDPAPYQLLSDDPASLYIAQSGLLSSNGPDTSQGQAIYTASQSDYQLANGQQALTVDLKWRSPNGVQISKRFTFTRGSYQIGVNYQIKNNSSADWSGRFYAQLQRKKVEPKSHSLFMINPYVGGAISTSEHPYQKISFAKMAEQNLDLTNTGGWAAMLEHYFLSAWIPAPDQQVTYYSKTNDNIYTLGLISQPLNVAPHSENTIAAKLYVGPESMDQLKAAAPHLNLTVDYGILWFISIAIFWALKFIYLFVGNWGWSIVIVTMLIKLAFYPLSAKSYRSMAAMRNLQPRLKQLRERHGDDRQKMTQATMELYKTEKINPLGGCLPMIVQIPVFIALYWVLLESVELRQAPFILWIHDLAAVDPWHILPIIMGLTMFIQQKLNPPPPDPVQAKVMQFLPVFFTFLFWSFPAGLVLYLVVNNSLSILQQWYIMRSVSKV
jgi:YidC/Oxa1 family membrane protein insertase